MKEPSSIEKGDSLEKRIYEIMKDLLEKGQLPNNPKTSKIYWKRKYFSSTRNSEIEFDIAIESYHAGSDKYSNLTLFECKNYKSSVEVKHLESFGSRLSQVGEHNTKGYFICSTSFQKAAINFAISNKIAIAIINGNNEIGWLSHRVDKSVLGNNLALIQSILTGKEKKSSFFGCNDGWSFQSLPDMLIDAGLIHKYVLNDKYFDNPYVKDSDIMDLISTLDINKCYDGRRLNIENLCELMSMHYDVNFVFSKSLGQNKLSNILGSIVYDPLEIFVTQELISEPNRFRFTLCHEIGHLVLHYGLFKNYFELFIDTEDPDFSNDFISAQTSKSIEFQANMFASELLLPTYSFTDFVLRYFNRESIYKPCLIMDRQPANRQRVFDLLQEIVKCYGVSMEAAKIRLIKLNLLKVIQEENSFQNEIHKISKVRFN